MVSFLFFVFLSEIKTLFSPSTTRKKILTWYIYIYISYRIRCYYYACFCTRIIRGVINIFSWNVGVFSESTESLEPHADRQLLFHSIDYFLRTDNSLVVTRYAVRVHLPFENKKFSKKYKYRTRDNNNIYY